MYFNNPPAMHVTKSEEFSSSNTTKDEDLSGSNTIWTPRSSDMCNIFDRIKPTWLGPDTFTHTPRKKNATMKLPNLEKKISPFLSLPSYEDEDTKINLLELPVEGSFVSVSKPEKPSVLH